MAQTDNYRPEFEQVAAPESQSFRWFCHDFPHPLALWHYHPEFEIHLIQASCGKAFVGDYIGAFQPGTLMMTGPNLPHNWISELSPQETVLARDILIQFSGKFMQQCEAIFLELTPLNLLLDEARLGIEFYGATARRGAELMQQLGVASGPQRVILLLTLLQELNDSTEKRLLSSADYIPTLDLQSLEKINRAIQFVFENYEQDLKLADVAEQLCMCDSTFSRFFKKNTGHNFVPYLNQLRINQACLLLLNSSRAVSLICHEVGFNNLSNFNRTFVRIKGITPTQFREQHHTP